MYLILDYCTFRFRISVKSKKIQRSLKILSEILCTITEKILVSYVVEKLKERANSSRLVWRLENSELLNGFSYNLVTISTNPQQVWFKCKSIILPTSEKIKRAFRMDKYKTQPECPKNLSINLLKGIFHDIQLVLYALRLLPQYSTGWF